MAERATVREPARDVPVVARPDVVVVGAGAAGIAAAVAAGRRGADVWLLDAAPFVGGLATLGLVNLLLTLDDGAGTQVVAGLCQEVVDRLDARGDARFPSPGQWDDETPDVVDAWRRWGLVWGAPPEAVRYSVAFDPEALIDVAHDLLDVAGVHLRLQAWFAGVVRGDDGRIEAVLVESKAGRQAVCPAVVVDATGDGDVAVACGAEHDHVTIPPHLWLRIGGVDLDVAERTPGPWFRTTSAGRVLVPWGPGPERVDACDPDEVTRALLEGRRAGRALFEQLRSSAPGFASAWLDDHARLLGVTESRRLVGDHVLAKEEGDVPFADAIARTGHWTKRGVVYDIPYRCLTTPAAPNLLVAGRCISTTRYVHQATKEIPAAMATGEAAGAAAARTAAVGGAAAGRVRDLDVAELRADLAAGGALVGAGTAPVAP